MYLLSIQYTHTIIYTHTPTYISIYISYCSVPASSQAVLILSRGIFLDPVPYYKYSATGIIGTSTAGLATT